MVCCLLADPDLWKRLPLKCSITMIFICPLLPWCQISSPFRENNNVVVFPFFFHIIIPLANLWFICLPILGTSFPDIYPLTLAPGRPLALGRGRILNPRFIRSHPTLAVYDGAHFFPQGGVGRGFPSLRMRFEGISHTSLVLFEIQFYCCRNTYFFKDYLFWSCGHEF